MWNASQRKDMGSTSSGHGALGMGGRRTTTLVASKENTRGSPTTTAQQRSVERAAQRLVFAQAAGYQIN